MNTYESVLLVMIGIVVIWDKILKPLNQRGVESIFGKEEEAT